MNEEWVCVFLDDTGDSYICDLDFSLIYLVSGYRWFGMADDDEGAWSLCELAKEERR